MLARLAATAGVIAFLGLGAFLIFEAVIGGTGHTLRASFDSVVQITDGQEVRLAGRKVGEVGDIRLVDGHPVVELRIEDGDSWPLPRGTRPRIRWGSTTSYLLRYIELQPGPDSAPPLPDRALLPRGDTQSAFELDQAYRIFRGRTDRDTGELVEELGATFDGRARALRRGLEATPGGLDEAGAFTRELAADELALRRLALAGDRTLGALARRERELGEVVDGAAGTFDEFAEHASAQARALDRAPRTFDTSTSTLARLDRSLVGLDALVSDLRPGAPALRRLARSARPALAELRRSAPLAASTLRSGRAAAPSLNQLFSTGTSFLPRFGDVIGQLNPMLGCLRPYGPEIAGFLSTWTGFAKNYDARGHYARSFPLEYNPTILPGTQNSSKAVTDQSELRYAMPRPPGLNAGQPWFQPQCGASPDSLDPAKDPERPGAPR